MPIVLTNPKSHVANMNDIKGVVWIRQARDYIVNEPSGKSQAQD